MLITNVPKFCIYKYKPMVSHKNFKPLVSKQFGSRIPSVLL